MSKDFLPPAFGSQGVGVGLGTNAGLSGLSGLGGVGPGSQPVEEDGKELDYMEMPREMATFDPPIAPEPEDTQGMQAGKAKLEELLVALKAYKVGGEKGKVDISALTELDLGLINQILGEGEVSIVCGSAIQAQESVLAGVWRVLTHDETGRLIRDEIEIADYPACVEKAVFAKAQERVGDVDAQLPPGIFNAPSLVSELQDKQGSYKQSDPVHSINLTLLPQTEEDLAYLDAKLGKGDVVILSRGYGNCRVSSTGTRNVWWVQYYNSQDAIILNSIEVIDVPEVVCAAQEDIEDSAERLNEILMLYRDEDA